MVKGNGLTPFFPRSGDVFNLGLQWHSPNEEENEFVQELFDRFVVPELEELDAFSDEKLTLKREQLKRSLNLVLQTMQGLASALPQWQGTIIHPLPSKVRECFVWDATAFLRCQDFNEFRSEKSAIHFLLYYIAWYFLQI